MGPNQADCLSICTGLVAFGIVIKGGLFKVGSGFSMSLGCSFMVAQLIAIVVCAIIGRRSKSKVPRVIQFACSAGAGVIAGIFFRAALGAAGSL